MAARKHSITLTTDGSGNVTGYSPYVSGYLESIQYVKNNYTDGVDFTITAEATTETLWTEANVNAAKVCRPRAATHSTAGVAALYASGGTAVNDKIALGRDRVKIVIGSGGAAHAGTFVVTVTD
jgi:hypothetical protein